jgi:hypothetical protein
MHIVENPEAVVGLNFKNGVQNFAWYCFVAIIQNLIRLKSSQ